MQRKYRKSIERLYTDKANIYEYRNIIDEETKETISNDPVLIYKDIPCRLSSQTISPSSNNEINRMTQSKTKLFTKPEYLIRPGSKIEITQSGNRVVVYNSGNGEPFIYESHQEIVLEEVKTI